MLRGKDSDERLELGAAFYQSDTKFAELHAESARFSFSRGEELVGRAWDTQKPLWMTDIDTAPEFQRQIIARKLGLKAALALPIAVRAQFFVVAEYLMAEQRSKDLEFGAIAERATDYVASQLMRIAAESALRQSERRFASFMQNLPAAAFIRDAEGRYLFVNAFVERTTRRPLKDWVGKTDAEIGTPGLEEIRATDRKVLDELKPVTRIVQTGHREPRHWMVSKFPLVGDADAPMIGTISLEITEQKRAEESQREGAERLRLLIDNVRDYAIYTIDPGHRNELERRRGAAQGLHRRRNHRP